MQQENWGSRQIDISDPVAARVAQERAYKAAYAQAKNAAGRDIGDLPPVFDPVRKGECAKSFKLYCETYHSHLYHLAWSDNHLRAIEIIERSVLKGGLFAFAMPRGTGKTSLCETAVQWATSYGYRSFVMIIGADQHAADQLLLSILMGFEVNETLAEDFPEICFPVQKIEGIGNRCRGQLHKGERTHIGITQHEIVLPTIEGSAASGAVIRSRGITGRIRGAKYLRSDGEAARPDIVVVDDPQTDESAASQTQVKTRMKVLSSAILGLSGPGQKIAGFMPCTVIEPRDLADQILDRSQHPAWHGLRTKMIDRLPSDEGLWEEYERILKSSLENELGMQPANDFYIEHQERMDLDCQSSWPERFEEDEVSAIQHAMNILFLRPDAFWSEYQNDPKGEAEDEAQLCDKDFKGSITPRGSVDPTIDLLTAFIDVQQECLFWMVCGWNESAGGSIVDWGTYPEQPQRYFQKAKLGSKLSSRFREENLEERLYRALGAVCDGLVPHRFSRSGEGDDVFIKRVLIDANWHLSTDVVYQFCKECEYPDRVQPSHGRYVGAGGKQLNDRSRKRGDKMGNEWIIPGALNGRPVRAVRFDTNYWKSFVRNRLKSPMGNRTSLLINGGDPPRLLKDHLLSEFFVETEGRGRKVDEWRQRPSGIDNDWFDCVVGCALAASMEGIKLSKMAQETRGRRERRSVRLPGRRG